MPDENQESIVQGDLPTKKPTRRRSPAKKTSKPTDNRREVDEFLKDIYQNNGGNNLKRIKMKKRHPIFKFFFTLIILGAIFAGVAWFGFLTFPGNKTSSDDITLTIVGAANVGLGVTTTYQINYENKSKEAIKNAVLTLKYPAGFKFIESQPAPKNEGKTEWQLPDLNAGEKGTVSITGKLYGSLNEEQSWRAFFDYTPNNLQSALQSVATLVTKVDEVPVKMSITSPDKSSYGTDVTYKITVQKISDSIPNKLNLVLGLPSNFNLTTTSPALGKNNTWNIVWDTNSTTLNQMEFDVTGQYTDAGQIVSSTPFSAALQINDENNNTFELAKNEVNTELSNNEVILNLAVNGSIKDLTATPDGLLNISLALKNNGKTALKNAKIKLILDTPSLDGKSILDWSKISDAADGDIQGVQLNDDLRRGQIIWSKTHIKDLEKISSNKDLTVELNLPVKNSQNNDLSEYKESVVKATAEIDFTDENGDDKIVASNSVTITINSDLELGLQDNIAINSNNKKVHNITWTLTNSLHPLKNLKITADTYGDVTFATGNVSNGSINFDQSTKQITWSANNMPLELDSLTIPFSITLNKENPTQQILLTKVKVEAVDAVTNQTIQFMGSDIRLK